MSGVYRGSGPSSKLRTIEWPRSGRCSKGRVRTGGRAGLNRGGAWPVMGGEPVRGGAAPDGGRGPAAAAGGVLAVGAGRVGVDAGSAAISRTAVAVPSASAILNSVRRSGRG